MKFFLHFDSLAFIILIIFISILNPQIIYGRVDDDTEATNTSFEEETKNLMGNDQCQIKIKVDNDDNYVDATAIVEEPFKMPTCLKEFYEVSHLGKCGKPMYNKFAYCAKALHLGNKNYNDVKALELMKSYKFLVLIDGCVVCPYWRERGALLEIKLKNKKVVHAITRSDAYGDFKIGAIFQLGKKERHFQPELEVKHTCNQYTQYQTQILRLPVLYRYREIFMRYEAKLSVIMLPQGDSSLLITQLDPTIKPKKHKEDKKLKADNK